MTEQQTNLFADADFDELLQHLPAVIGDEQKAMANFGEHLFAWVKITQRVLTKSKVDDSFKTSCEIIAQIAHYQGGENRYLPRADKLKAELRDIHIFNLWHDKSWPVDKIRREFCPELSQMTVYSILQKMRHAHLKKIQPNLI